jgi:hypothetical protein
LLASKFAQVYSSGYVRIGGTKTLSFTSAAAVHAFLPAGGTPAMLNATATNPTSSSAGVLAGQVLALQLNVDFSRAGVTKPGLGDLLYQGYPVSVVLDAANQVLGGNTSVLDAVGLNISDLNAIIDAINNNFDNGTVNTGGLTCPTGTCAAGTIVLNDGTSSTSGTAGNIRSFTGNGVNVKVSAFSRAKSNGAWSTAFLGAYGTAGLGVTDASEGSGSNNQHKVDNMGDRLNYMLFEFSKPVVVTKAWLDYIGADSDATIWVGNKSTDPYTNHLTLSDSLLASLGAQQSSTATSTEDRWATFNGDAVAVNVVVIAADVNDTTPEDEFKIVKIDVTCASAPVNQAPTLTLANRTNFKNAAINVQITGDDADDDALTYTATGLPTGLTMSTVGLITGTATTLGTYNVTVTVKDSSNATASATFVWTVTNRPPTVSAANRTDYRGAAVSVQIAGSDADGDALTYSATGLPTGLSMSAAGLITGTPTTLGTYSVTVTVKDSSNATATATFTWTIANRPPTVTASNRVDNKGTAVNFQIAGSDPDGDALTYTATGLPPGASISSTGKITGTLTTAGNYSVTVTVKDPSGSSASTTFSWTVKAPNVAPDAKNDSVTTQKNTKKTLTVLSNDTDANTGDVLTVTSVTQPSKGSVTHNSNGTLTFTPKANGVGTTTFTYTIGDGNGGTDTATVTVTVGSHSDNDGCNGDHNHDGRSNDDYDHRERDCDRDHQHTRDCDHDRSHR